MEDSIVIPWPEVVKQKQARDSDLLQTIEHYHTISEAPEIATPAREEALRLMKSYQRIYLGLPTNGL